MLSPGMYQKFSPSYRLSMDSPEMKTWISMVKTEKTMDKASNWTLSMDTVHG
ncbi:hypothetical protein DPMN_055030 [Dreissena polymorpha]|uniref:Uncharacterized protein n=1 Tax=Dreissena polymorpha TaxID=45954 RepID=A0A9D4CR13_DREPO|nr:hypothetical protein DPMN_055030 [Dreissena polymorpha]